MTERTFKLIELVGISEKGYEEAINNAVKRASKTLDGISWVEVQELRGLVKNGKVAEYQVKVKVAFKLKDRAAD